ncbi:MAG: hypothetical protein QOD26_780 [Betaproteobacteria bacterium]|nr:hypothetical protein [Betaproteobacteria bacterium]
MFTIIGRVYDAKVRFLRATASDAEDIVSVDKEFDCFLVNRLKDAALTQGRLLEAIARRANWVEIFGVDAEALHDAVDQAGVHLGRQVAIGEGYPMTAWYDDISDNSAIASYIATGGQGDSLHKIVVLIGSPSEESGLIDELRKHRTGDS